MPFLPQPGINARLTARVALPFVRADNDFLQLGLRMPTFTPTPFPRTVGRLCAYSSGSHPLHHNATRRLLGHAPLYESPPARHYVQLIQRPHDHQNDGTPEPHPHISDKAFNIVQHCRIIHTTTMHTDNERQSSKMAESQRKQAYTISMHFYGKSTKHNKGSRVQVPPARQLGWKPSGFHPFAFRTRGRMRSSYTASTGTPATWPTGTKPLRYAQSPPPLKLQHARPLRTLTHRDRDLIIKTALFRRS